ncbi:MAG: hypothetical protein RIQ55_901 [Pseudomonadota bacterium]
MKLLGAPASPYARKVRLMLLEKHIPHDYLIDMPREPDSQVARVNPLGRIPALILDDETCVFDSPVITEYVDSLNDTPILIPRDNAIARMRVRRWEALADGIMDAAIAVRTERIRPEDKQEPGNITLHNNAISRSLEFASTHLGNDAWVNGQMISLGDLALFAALVYLNLRQPERDWRTPHPNLAALFDQIAQRPSGKQTLTEQ